MKKSCFLLAVIPLFFLTGCMTGKQEKEADLPPGQTGYVDLFGRRVGEEMLKAFRNDDYEGFTEFFTDELKNRTGKADFAELRSTGTLRGYRYLDSFKTAHTRCYLWKVILDDGNSEPSERMFQILLQKVEDDYQVGGCRFL